ncbi:hypothetical protein [Streptomyces anulatus]|uniref:hypothetical protein n=1 Tax=Streptomyces anulatus TaxID=1892 RepID=UPI002E14BDE0|nr:hypothetical protein OG557_38925 [Streptomyces anulatus]
MTTAETLTADTALAKHRLIRDWSDSGAGCWATLVDWVQTTADDGSPLVSARLAGPHEPDALVVFGARQESYLALQRPVPGDVLPTLDYTVPGRVACVWRQDGVWTEVWHPNTPEAPTAAVTPPRVVPAPPPRATVAVTPSGRLPRRPANRFRHTPKEQ